MYIKDLLSCKLLVRGRMHELEFIAVSISSQSNFCISIFIVLHLLLYLFLTIFFILYCPSTCFLSHWLVILMWIFMTHLITNHLHSHLCNITQCSFSLTQVVPSPTCIAPKVLLWDYQQSWKFWPCRNKVIATREWNKQCVTVWMSNKADFKKANYPECTTLQWCE